MSEALWRSLQEEKTRFRAAGAVMNGLKSAVHNLGWGLFDGQAALDGKFSADLKPVGALQS